MGVFDWLFPKTCVGCGSWGAYLCSDCVNLFSLTKHLICPVCKKPSITGETHARCKTALGMDGLVSSFMYKGMMRRLIAKLKYRMVTDLFTDLIEVWVSLGIWEVLINKQWLVVGVPLHKSRYRWRGFNQADELGKRIAMYFGWEFGEGILSRIKQTKPQVGMKAIERRENMRGVFACVGKELIYDKDILLIDDVWTTGSTMRECAKVLKRAGAGSVWGVTLARG